MRSRKNHLIHLCSLLLMLVPWPGVAQTQSDPVAPAAPAAAAQDMSAISPEQLLLQQAFEALGSGKAETAREALTKLLTANPEPWVHVLIAASWSLDGKCNEAFQALDIALTGFEQDPLAAGPMCCDLAAELVSEEKWQALRSDARFNSLLARAKQSTWHPEVLKFDAAVAGEPLRFPRPDVHSPALKELRETYRLDLVIAEAADDLDRVKRICRWVHARTSHDGWSYDYPTGAVALLKAAEKGAQWRCVEFGIVMSECLKAVGIPARKVSARARDVEALLAGAGHVFAEAWLEDRQCWVLVDAQMGLVGLDRDGTPLNSIEFRNALASPDSPLSYPKPLAMCLYYFCFADFPDDRVLMLAPVGAKMPTKFQRKPASPPDIFTHRISEAYAAPR